MSLRSRDDVPLLPGFVAGVLAWLAGYAVTYLVVGSDLRQSSFNRAIEVFEGEQATVEMVGWVLFNAHFVDTVVRGLPVVGRRTTTFIGGDGGFTPALYLVPPLLLLVAGVVLGRIAATANGSSASAGVAVVPGYLLASLVGAIGFEVTAAGTTAGPELVPAVALAGIAYPVVFGTVGAVFASVTIRERRTPHT